MGDGRFQALRLCTLVCALEGRPFVVRPLIVEGVGSPNLRAWLALQGEFGLVWFGLRWP